MDPSVEAFRTLYAQRNNGQLKSGFYNDNHLLTTDDGRRVVVRVPRATDDDLEPRRFDEASVLRCVHVLGINVPRLLWSDGEWGFQVQEFIEGDLMNEVCPRGRKVPGYFIDDVAYLFDSLSKLTDLETVRPAQQAWRRPAGCQDFFMMLLEWEVRVWESWFPRMAYFFEWIGLTASPFEPLRAAGNSLRDRRLVLCHGDVQRLNCLLREDTSWFLDWELALQADPLWDVATHCHRMRYLPEEEISLMSKLAEIGRVTEADLPDYRAYFDLECLKSVVNDGVRYVAAAKKGATDEQIAFFATEYAWKLALAAKSTELQLRGCEELSQFLTVMRDGDTAPIEGR